MQKFNWRHRVVLVFSLLAVPVLTGAEANGCGGGDDCVTGGCSGTVCHEPGEEIITTCEWLPEYDCYKQHGVCERNASDQCGWRSSQALQDCIAAARSAMPE